MAEVAKVALVAEVVALGNSRPSKIQEAPVLFLSMGKKPLHPPKANRLLTWYTSNTFATKAEAEQRACSIQRNSCADMVNNGSLPGKTLADCDGQAAACQG